MTDQVTVDVSKEMSGKHVLVTGATGFTGSCLTRKLVEHGATVTAIARRPEATQQFDGLDIRWVIGNVFSEEAINECFQEEIAYVFHVAAAYREARISDETYRNVHVKSTQLLANRAANTANFARFVHVSTVGVHGHIENPPADEDYPFHPGDIYQETKAEAELWIRDFSAQSGMPTTVIRPTPIYGPGDRRLLKVFRMASRRFFPILGFGQCLYHLVHVQDLSDFIILAGVHPKASGEVYICGNSSPISLKDMATVISREYGNKLIFIRLPAWPFFIAGAICELLCKPLGIEPPIYRRRVAFFTKDRAFDTRKMETLGGFVPGFSNDSGLRAAAQWYLENGWVRP